MLNYILGNILQGIYDVIATDRNDKIASYVWRHSAM